MYICSHTKSTFFVDKFNLYKNSPTTTEFSSSYSLVKCLHKYLYLTTSWLVTIELDWARIFYQTVFTTCQRFVGWSISQALGGFSPQLYPWNLSSACLHYFHTRPRQFMHFMKCQQSLWSLTCIIPSCSQEHPAEWTEELLSLPNR